jgi:phosphatidylinositol kinase/protein kinase (PI-3  family)
MNSIRRPKRLIIRGNDQKDHSFLVKGGEDQRQGCLFGGQFSIRKIFFLIFRFISR